MTTLQDNLNRIRELTETVVPFSHTIRGKEIMDPDSGKMAIMNYIHNEDDFAVVTVDIEAGFLHHNHFHKEYEVVCLLKGQLFMINKGIETPVPVNIPIIIEPLEGHTMFYPVQSKVVAITIPAAKEFPNTKK